MTTDVPSPLVPKLRFPEFRITGDWKRDQIGNIASISKGKGVSKADIEKSGFTPCIRYAELYTHYGEVIREALSHTNVPPEDLVLSQAEDVIVPASGETRADIARAACVVPAGVALGGDLNILRSDLSGRFFSYLLNSPLRSKIARLAQGDTVAHLYPGQLSKVTISYPLPAEQQKIADCLGSLDDLIAADGRKLEALRQHKQGLMQELFPQPGETVPRLRFPEFREAGEWEERLVGDVFKVTRGEVLAMPLVRDSRSNETPFPVYSSQTKNRGLAGYYSDYLYEDAITWTTDGANAGDVNYRTGKFFCTNVCGVLIDNDGQANLCTAELINSVSRQHVSFVGNPKLMNGVMAKIAVPFPALAEQQRIATCLSSLEDVLAAQARKIDALKQQKQGLLQQFFPSLETE